MDDFERVVRVADIMATEQSRPEGYWWLSFVDATRPTGQQSLGVAVVRARGPATATREAWRLGINPGGEVAAWELPDDLEDLRQIVDGMLNKLTTRAGAEAAGVGVVSLGGD